MIGILLNIFFANTQVGLSSFFSEYIFLFCFINPVDDSNHTKNLLDIISSLFRTNNIGMNEKANAARGCKPDGIITLSKLYFSQSCSNPPPVVIAQIFA